MKLWGIYENVTSGTSRHFSNYKREYLKGEINELKTSSREKNIRDCIVT
jgi:hypothetical protein